MKTLIVGMEARVAALDVAVGLPRKVGFRKGVLVVVTGGVFGRV